MPRQQLALRIATLAVIIQILAAQRADAYIDPGSGSFFVQMLLAGLLGAGMAVKTYWHRIKGLFTRSKSSSTPPPEDESADS